MLTYNTLENTKIEVLHQAFVEAFSDYQVRIELPFWKFEQMLQRRGYHSELSIGAFDDDQLIGFVLNGYRDWYGRKTVYDLGTGVIPEYRRQGITSEMLKHIKDLFQEKGPEQYLLEVITTNTSAVQLYNKQGFEIQREFRCYDINIEKWQANLLDNKMNWQANSLVMNKKDYTSQITCSIEHVDSIDFSQVMDFWDFEPSWQNSIASINALPEAFAYSVIRENNTIVGYGIIDKRTGDIPQIAVSKEHRKNGIARSLIADLISQTESDKIGILNVATDCKSLNAFLINLGFQYRVGQYEMLLHL